MSRFRVVWTGPAHRARRGSVPLGGSRCSGRRLSALQDREQSTHQRHPRLRDPPRVSDLTLTVGSMTLLAAPTLGAWTPLGDASGGAGYLSVYRSDPLARYPIRHVTKKADNKSDPNIETGTYGLFSTCERPMRRKIVREGRPHLFFVTSHGRSSRALTGYYELGWFAESTGGAATGDYALAATKIRFIEPIPLDVLPEPVRNVRRHPVNSPRTVVDRAGRGRRRTTHTAHTHAGNR